MNGRPTLPSAFIVPSSAAGQKVASGADLDAGASRRSHPTLTAKEINCSIVINNRHKGREVLGKLFKRNYVLFFRMLGKLLEDFRVLLISVKR